MNKGSSLERAAAASRGAFESCFSNGLDLSDFAEHARIDPPGVSHAASLLRRKQVEAAQKLEQEREELNLQSLLQERVASIQRAKEEEPILLASRPLHPNPTEQQSPLLSNNSLKKSDMINTAVVAMHSAEKKEEPRQKLGKRVKNKALPTKRSPHATKTNAKAIKKSVRTKYK
jgi:hypothetical protein